MREAVCVTRRMDITRSSFPAFFAAEIPRRPQSHLTWHTPKCASLPLHEGEREGKDEKGSSSPGERPHVWNEPQEMAVAQIGGRPRQMCCCLEPLLLFFPSRSPVLFNDRPEPKSSTTTAIPTTTPSKNIANVNIRRILAC